MAGKRKSKFPKWIVDTLQISTMIIILMAAYNFFGPTFIKNGSFMPWWTFPYSIAATILIVGGWKFFAHRMDLIRVEMKREDEAKQKAAEERARKAAASDAKAAEVRRQRNQSQQQSR
ncbi:hypothetical protein [Lentilactobacillus sp. Marseille-Q4993]|uniref:hypothetical protein n=1 Tax=Lentilactobacillus sp. Marseille-Q4993 TaxID=3039492 RepID=UPI0024BCEC0A|nr:hypothetical protein [Lentilactobacillus sp. Marseille-Q4993]